MASYTDDPRLLSQFNPYVQQLPIEAMREVGMYKQQQYNEGIQKIQTNIDNIAGLDIGRPVERKYLQSKINQLGNNLRTVAAGDFSDFQLVNSTTGMINQISKDPIIVAGVQSTSRDRKQLAQMEDDKKKGTLTPHAEYNYNKQRMEYYNNPNLKDDSGKPIVYSGTYTPSWDIDKNIMEAIKMVGDSKWSAENVFKMGQDGRPMKNPDGSPVFSDFAIKEIRAGKFNTNILAAIDTVLIRPEAKQELAMQGVYNYRGYPSTEAFVQSYQKEKDHGISIARQKLDDLMTKISNSTDEKEKAQLRQGMKTVEDQLAEYEQAEDSKIAYAKSFDSADAFKIAMHTQQVRNNYSKAATTETFSREYIKNIPYEVKQEKIKAERDWYIAQETKKLGWANYDLSKRGQDRADRAQAFNEEKWKYDPTNPKNIVAGEQGLEKPVEATNAYIDFNQKGEELTTNFKESQRDFLVDYFKATWTASGKQYTEGQLEKAVAKGMREDPDYLTRNYTVAMRNVKGNPKNKYYTNLVTHIPNLTTLEQEMEDHNAMTTNMNNSEGVKRAGGQEVDIKGISKGILPIKINMQEGGFLGFGGTTKQVTVSPEDIVNFGYIRNYGDIFSSKDERYRAKVMETSLRAKMGDAAYERASEILKNPEMFANSNYAEGLTNTNISGILKSHRKVQKETFSNVIKAKEEYLKNVSKGNSPVTYTIYEPGAKGPEVQTTNNNLKAVLNLQKDVDVDMSKFDEFFKDPATSGYSVAINVNRGTPGSYKEDYSINLYSGEELLQSVPVSKQNANYIKKLNVPNPASRAVVRVQASAKHNTTNSLTDNVMSPDAYQSAFVKQDFFASFKRPDIHGADIVKNKAGEYNVYIYTDDSGSGDIIGYPIKASADEILPHSFPSIDAANQFIHNELPRPGFINYTLNNFKK